MIMSDLTGQQLGKYHLQQSLGAGGYAQVYLGEHIHLKTKFAVKVLDEMLKQEAQTKFLIEAQRIASLKHPNIVAVTDFDVIGNRAFLVLEYAPKGTPKRTNGVPMSPQLVASYIKQIAAALQYIHDEKRWVHCDVKPVNMLLWENDQLKLSDFGITQLARGNDASTLQHIEGTSAYMAPEHWKGKFVFATDQYSLGVVAYEWLSGDLPFHGGSLDMQRQHLHDAPPPLHRRNPAISMSVEQVVNRALHKDPQQRYPRVMDFALALEQALKYTAHPPQRSQATRLQGESLLPPLLMREQQSPKTSPNPMVLASPTSNSFQAHFDPTIPASFNPSTPLPPEEPEMPVHELLLEQQKLVLHFVEVARVQDERRKDITQQIVTARNAAADKRKQGLAKTDDDVDYVRRCTAELKENVKQQGWYGLARKFTHNPFAFKAVNTPSQQIHEFRQEVDADREIIVSFLRQYGDPSTLIKTCIRVGGASAALIGFVWAVFIIGGFHLWNAFTIIGLFFVMALFFGGAAIWFGVSRIANMGKALYHLKQLNKLTEEILHARRQSIEESYQRELDRIEQNAQRAFNQLMQELQRQLPVRQTEVDDFMKKLGFAGSDWNDPLWQERRTIRATPPVARIGKLTVNATPTLPAIPALVSCPNGSNLLLEASGAAKSATISTALSCILRLLLTQTPGNVHFTFIDPIRYGRNFDPFLWLSEHSDILLTGEVVAEPQQIAQQLAELTGHIARITRQHSHSLKEVAEPYRVLVVMDFPANFTAATAQQLLAIARNGPRCGISSVIVIDEARSLQALQDFELSTLEQLAMVIRWNGQNFILQSDEGQGCYLELDRLPEENIYRPLIQSLQETMHAASSVEHNPLLQEWLERPTWLGPHEQVKVWLGYPVTSKEPLVCPLHRQSDSNLLIVGKQRDVGTGMLLTEIMSIAAQQPPARAQFSILDVSVGDMSVTYGTGVQPFELIKQLLPGYKMQIVHRRNLPNELPSLMNALRTEMSSRRQSDSAEKPSLYLFICGLHRLYDLWQNDEQLGQGNEHQVARQTMQLLQDILSNGPEFGIHTLTWCDTLSGLDNVLGANMLRHFDVRIAFPTSPREEIMTLVERSSLPALDSRLALYYNREEMRLEKFRPFQLPSKEWLQQAAAFIRRKGEA